MTSWQLHHNDPDDEGWLPRPGDGFQVLTQDGLLLLEDGDEFSGWFLLEDDTDGTAGILLEDA